MANSKQQQKLAARRGRVQRPRYAVGDYLAADDLLTEQTYRWHRLRRHNRFLHGWGVVCGLRVVPARQPSRPWAVIICPGYGITCCGDEVEVPNATLLNIIDYVWASPVETGVFIGPKPALVAYIGIRYAEEHTRPVATRSPYCKCEDSGYHMSRVSDSFEADVLWVLPETTDGTFDLCAGQIAPCPQCGENEYIILARVTLPPSEAEPITAAHIDNLT